MHWTANPCNNQRLHIYSEQLPAAKEKPFDKELIQALHDLPFSSAEERREFGKKIAEQGIFKASQLQSVRKSNLPPGASPMLAAKFAEAKSSYKSEKLHEPEGPKRARENRKELKEDLEEQS